MDILIYLLIGLITGYVGGYAGIGGGPFIVAALVLFAGLTQLEAQGSMLAIMMGPMSFLGVLSLKQEVKALLPSIIIGVISYCIFSYLGAVFAFYIGEMDMRLYFAILLIVLGVLQLKNFSFKTNELSSKKKIAHGWILLLGAITGIFGGLFGIGAGVLMVPVLIQFFTMDKNYARALSLAILLPPVSLGGFLKYNAEMPVNWTLVICVFLGYFVANHFGAKRGNLSSNTNFKKYYAFLLFALSLVYLLVLV